LLQRPTVIGRFSCVSTVRRPSVPVRALLARSALVLLALLGTAVAAVGGVSLGGSGLVVVGLAAVISGCLAAGIARDGDSPDPVQAAVEAGWRCAVGTVAVILVVTGCGVLIGGALTALLAGTVLGAVLVHWLLRWRRPGRSIGVAPVVPLTGVGELPVQSLSVEALGQEWLRTSAALARGPGAALRQVLVDRRQQALDELERRDPAGFARWLAQDAFVDSDPARYVSSDPAAGYDAA
jgi:hypothetical protein